MDNRINAVIIATEITKGMKSIGPKSLLQIKKTLSVIEYQIDELKKSNKNINIIIATGFESDKMMKTLSKYQVQTIHNEDYRTTNQSKSIVDYIANNDISNLLVINNGILFKGIFSELKHNNPKSTIYVLDKNKTDFDIGCNISTDTTYLFYDLPEKWSECVFLNKEAIDATRLISKTKNINQLYTFELINILVDSGQHFQKSRISKNTIMKISNVKDLNKAKVFVS